MPRLTDDEFQHWTTRKAEMRDKKARNREYALAMLERMGYQLEHIPSKRVIIRHQGKVIYFVLGTGGWNCIAPVSARGRGVHNLIHFIATGEVISRESIEAKQNGR